MGGTFGVYKLDARPDRIDLRDRAYQPPLKALLPEYPAAEFVEKFFPLYEDLVLNQGAEGACTGFGLACTINYLLLRQVADKKQEAMTRADLPQQVSYRMLYHLARFYDEWPGEDYSGSSCRGAVKAWYKHGVCSRDLWPYRNTSGEEEFIKPKDGWEEDAATRPLGVYYRVNKESLTDMRAAIQEVGAVYVSAKVHDGWSVRSSVLSMPSHESLPRIEWQEKAENTGGHAFALVGYNRHGFIVQNSWGPGWGQKGFAILGFEDWLANGSDAWACVMGAPAVGRVKNHFIPSSSNREEALLKRDPVQFGFFSKKKSEHDYKDRAVCPWTEEKAYGHTLVMGNDGKVINRLLANNGPGDTVDDIILEKGSKWFEKVAGGGRRLVIYAHGGLNSEADSIGRIRVLAPYFMANGIYPVFLTWRTGVLESIAAIMGDAVGRLFPHSKGLSDLLDHARDRAADVLDRTLEVACENLGVKAIWSQMKQNAEQSAALGDYDRGTYLLRKRLELLKERFPDLELHLIGHSAGSIILGHFLQDCVKQKLPVASCTLYAPACSVEFATRKYVNAHEKEVLDRKNLAIHLLSEENELGDHVGPYRKSLLYLVSRALENYHKTPLLGMKKVFDKNAISDGSFHERAKKDIEEWLEFWGESPLYEVCTRQVATAFESTAGAEEAVQIAAAHGSFDNDVVVVQQTIERILGAPVSHRVENLRY